MALRWLWGRAPVLYIMKRPSIEVRSSKPCLETAVLQMEGKKRNCIRGYLGETSPGRERWISLRIVVHGNWPVMKEICPLSMEIGPLSWIAWQNDKKEAHIQTWNIYRWSIWSNSPLERLLCWYTPSRTRNNENWFKPYFVRTNDWISKYFDWFNWMNATTI